MQTSSSSSMQRDNRGDVIALSIVGDDVSVSVNGRGLPTPRGEAQGKDRGARNGEGRAGGKATGPPG